jgi:hypothetical protein
MRTLAIAAAAATAFAVVAVAGTNVATAVVRDSTAVRAGTAPNHKISNSASTNWAGYAVSGGRYTTMSTAWTQPAVRCTATAYSSFWVGIDGDTSGTVEQTGTAADCSGTTPVYYSWYEMYPKAPVAFRAPVAPGDHFAGSVVTNGRGRFTLTLTDTTKGWTRSVTKRLASARLASAEAIAEAPSSSSGVLPLANFGTAAFSAAKVNGSTLTTRSAGIDAITMRSGSTIKAQPSAISNGAFSVTWKHS